MEKPTHFRPIIPQDDDGINIDWVHELDRKCTKWLRARDLYWDADKWRDELYKRSIAERKVREHERLDRMVDEMNRE